MDLYDCEKNKVLFYPGKAFYDGKMSTIYRLQHDYLIKIIKDNVKVSKNVIEESMKIKHNNFLDIREILTEEKDSLLVKGYLYKYITENNKIKLIDDLDYLFENIESLEELSILLADSYLFMTDIKPQNVVKSDQGIVVIDPDFYGISDNKNRILENNKKMVLRLIKMLIDEELKKENPSSIREVNQLLNSVNIDDNMNKQIKQKINQKIFKSKLNVE